MRKKPSKLVAVVALIIPVLGHTAFDPPEDGYDWIQLKSGEWLKGELIGLFDDEVEFDSEILEELVIDWEDVERIVSPRTYGVNVNGDGTLIGSLRFEGDRVFVFNDAGEFDVDRDELIGITASAERERDRWSVDVSLGINAREGNARFIEQNTIASAERRTPASRTNID